MTSETLERGGARPIVSLVDGGKDGSIEYLEEALVIAGVGLGVVAIALLTLMGILWALVRFLPAEEPHPKGESLGAKPGGARDPVPGRRDGPNDPDQRTRAMVAAAAVTVTLARAQHHGIAGSQPGNPKLNLWRLQGLQDLMTPPASGWKERRQQGETGGREGHWR